MITNETKPIYDQTLNSLFELKNACVGNSFVSASERKKFFDTVVKVRQDYKNLQTTVSGLKKETLRVPAMRMYVKRSIHPKQMEAWIDKLYLNLNKFMQDIYLKNVHEIVAFIDEQQILLTAVIKVLNGDARLLGCSHLHIPK